MSNFSWVKIDAVCKEIAYCTDKNLHNESLIILAEFMQEHNILHALDAVYTLHLYYTYMTSDLLNIRKDLSIRLFYQLEHCNVLSDIDKKRIKSSF